MISRLRNALGYSLAGLRAAYASERAFREETWAACILLPLALWLPDSGVGRALLVGSVLLVFLAELVNSAVEAVVDRISEERHPLSGKAKDLGSAAVLVAVVHLLAVWALVLL